MLQHLLAFILALAFLPFMHLVFISSTKLFYLMPAILQSHGLLSQQWMYYVWLSMQWAVIVAAVVYLIRLTLLHKEKIKRMLQVPGFSQSAIFMMYVAVYLASLLVLEVVMIDEANLYGGLKKVDKLVSEQQHVCDERGINKFMQNPSMGDSRQINKDGFISSYDFSKEVIDSIRQQDKKIVMVIGDSFTEGVSTSGWENSFMNLIRQLSSGYEVLNFGVGGQGPLNYYLITEKYLSVIKPDLLCVVTCDNDIYDPARLVTPGIPYWFQTNAGWICSQERFMYSNDSAGVFNDIHEAYEYLAVVPSRAQNSKLYAYIQLSPLLTTFTTLKHKAFSGDIFHIGKGKEEAAKLLRAINERCLKSNIPTVFLHIPLMNENTGKPGLPVSEYDDCFMELRGKACIFPYAEESLYIDGNGHFNDEGNKKFAVFADSVFTAFLKQSS